MAAMILRQVYLGPKFLRGTYLVILAAAYLGNGWSLFGSENFLEIIWVISRDHFISLYGSLNLRILCVILLAEIRSSIACKRIHSGSIIVTTIHLNLRINPVILQR